MSRADLLSLTEDDLIALTNRGTVKRAQREVDDPTTTCEIEESAAGDIKFVWSDGALCEIPAGASLREARCSSDSTGISRYLIRSVIAYQRGRSAEEVTSAPRSWDPGLEFSDEALEKHFGKAEISRARQRFEAGVLVEVLRGPKPLARFLDDPCFLRFMIPGDLRYLHADCTPAALGTFVPLAVWAFRRLPSGKDSALLSLNPQPLPTPVELLDGIEELLLECANNGIATVGDNWQQRLNRLEQSCREAELIWPADILTEFAEEYKRYVNHDSLFSLESTVALIGELLIRLDAIRAAHPDVPQILVRGTGADRRSDVVSARYIGLGCGVQSNRKSTIVTAYLQDVDSGAVVALPREFANSNNEGPQSSLEVRDYSVLSQTAIIRGVSLNAFGLGQVLLKSGKRTPSHRLVLPRTGNSGISVNPQGFAWEKLRAPLLCDTFRDLTALLAMRPPASLRSRRVTEDLFVIAVSRMADAGFDAATQTILITLFDSQGDKMTMRHPFSSRSASGSERLLDSLKDSTNVLKFVSGHVELVAGELIIRPLCVVFEQRGDRYAVQPWVDSAAKMPSSVEKMLEKSTENNTAATENLGNHPSSSSILTAALQSWQSAVGELWLLGTKRVSPDVVSLWQELVQRFESMGLLRFAEINSEIVSALSRRLSDPGYDGTAVAPQLLTATLLMKLADET